MKKIILGIISVILICVCAFSMLACTSINRVLEVRFGEFNIWAERILPEVLEYDMKKDGEIVGSYKTVVEQADETITYYATKDGIFEEEQSNPLYTFKVRSASFKATQTLTLNDGSYTMETVAYMTSTYMIEGSYTKIVNNGKEKIVVAKNIDEDRYYYTRFENGESVSEKIKLDKYRLEGYYDNTQFYFVLRSIPAEYAGYAFKLIDTDNKTTQKIQTTMDTKSQDYDIVTAVTDHKILGTYNKIECHVTRDEYRIITKIIEGDYTYELK